MVVLKCFSGHSRGLYSFSMHFNMFDRPLRSMAGCFTEVLGDSETKLDVPRGPVTFLKVFRGFWCKKNSISEVCLVNKLKDNFVKNITYLGGTPDSS